MGKRREFALWIRLPTWRTWSRAGVYPTEDRATLAAVSWRRMGYVCEVHPYGSEPDPIPVGEPVGERNHLRPSSRPIYRYHAPTSRPRFD